jgi:hypothetical protein
MEYYIVGDVGDKGEHKDIVVCCPDGYFRKGNVVITCGLNNVSVLNTYEEFLDEIKNKLK